MNSFLDYYTTVRKRTNRLLKIITPEHLDFTYKPGKFTIADQIRHIAAAERFVFCETIQGRKSSYPGCGNALADGYQNIMSFFNQMHSESVEIISTLTEDDLDRCCLTPAGTDIKIRKWLQLLAEHEIHHRGELYIYLNLLGLETPSIYGLTSEDLKSLSDPNINFK